MADKEHVEHLQKLLDLHRQRLRLLEEQAARYGISVDPIITIEIEDIKQTISSLQAQIGGLNPDKTTPEPINFLSAYQEACSAQAKAYKGHRITCSLWWFHTCSSHQSE